MMSNAFIKQQQFAKLTVLSSFASGEQFGFSKYKAGLGQVTASRLWFANVILDEKHILAIAKHDLLTITLHQIMDHFYKL